VKEYVFDVAGRIEVFFVFGDAFYLVFGKNEAMIGGLPGNSFVFMEFEKGGGFVEIATLAVGAVGLDVAKGLQGLLELAGETMALDAEVGDEAMGVNDIEGDFLIERDGGGGAREHLGFEQRDAVETPGGVDEFPDELRFGGGGGLIFVEELAAMVFKGGWIFGRKDGGCGGQPVAQRVQRGTLLAGFGARTGGMLGIGAVAGRAMGGRDCCS
jgi:hypothetical protein